MKTVVIFCLISLLALSVHGQGAGVIFSQNPMTNSVGPNDLLLVDSYLGNGKYSVRVISWTNLFAIILQAAITNTNTIPAIYVATNNGVSYGQSLSLPVVTDNLTFGNIGRISAYNTGSGGELAFAAGPGVTPDQYYLGSNAFFSHYNYQTLGTSGNLWGSDYVINTYTVYFGSTTGNGASYGIGTFNNPTFTLAGDPSIQGTANGAANTDFTVWIRCCNAFGSGAVNSFQIATTNSSFWQSGVVGTNSQGVKWGWDTTVFPSIAATAAQGPIGDLPGVFIMVDNQTPLAIASSHNIGLKAGFSSGQIITNIYTNVYGEIFSNTITLGSGGAIANYASVYHDPGIDHTYIPWHQPGVVFPNNPLWTNLIDFDQTNGAVTLGVAPTLTATNAGSGITVGTTSVKLFFSITNNGTIYRIPAY